MPDNDNIDLSAGALRIGASAHTLLNKSEDIVPFLEQLQADLHAKRLATLLDTKTPFIFGKDGSKITDTDFIKSKQQELYWLIRERVKCHDLLKLIKATNVMKHDMCGREAHRILENKRERDESEIVYHARQKIKALETIGMTAPTAEAFDHLSEQLEAIEERMPEAKRMQGDARASWFKGCVHPDLADVINHTARFSSKDMDDPDVACAEIRRTASHNLV